MKHLFYLLSVVVAFSVISCNQDAKKSEEKNKTNYDYSGVVVDVVQTSNYTYCLVKDDHNEHWLAISRTDISKGETLYFNQGMEMKDFHSKELDRTFPSIFFVQKASTDPDSDTFKPQAVAQKPVKPKIEKKELDVEQATDGVTIAELFENKEKYAGKKIKVRGKVTKFNTAIMNKNWAHIQDGTEFEGKFDLTVTTVEEVNVDAVVTFEGTINLDVDFGAGYFYDIIMQDAVIVK